MSINTDLGLIKNDDWLSSSLRWHLSVKSGEGIENLSIEPFKTTDKRIPVRGANRIIGYSDKSNVDSSTISIGRVGASGVVHLNEEPSWITDNSLIIHKFNSKIFDKKFLRYILEQLNLSQYSTSTAQPLITGETIKRRKIAFPDILTQKKIVNYIEYNVSEIDDLLIKKHQLINLLEQQRQSIITEAVTKGLNLNVKMKDSGVEWIGEIPEYWEVNKIKFKFDIRKVIQPTENPTVLSLTQRGLKIKDLNDFSGQHADSYDKYQKVEIKDYVMNGMDLLTGYVDCSRFEGVTSPDYRVFRIKDNTECHDYYLRYFQMCYFSKIFYGHGQGVSNFGRWRLQTDVFKEFPIPVPPKDEQFKVSEFLKAKEMKIDKALELINLDIEKLKEYRKSLIYEAVTGKIDVRDMELD
ncbi:restriction endonuclease subunit S [Bacillus subtilis]|uniref:restriction endonuclease subunit S n=1 Tax=Bacillus subtilis TaxID=1423 RepID=UPI0010EC810E|nr:restriction endonuclease subunit S [Bacillus subtilis]TDY54331.1 type I restriction enzyme S subunit [Bacillus subtilis]